MKISRQNFVFLPVFSAVTDDSSVCQESGPELVQSHDICESSSGSEPAGLNHGGEERDSACYVGEPETTAMEDACERSVSLVFVTSKQGPCLHKVSSPLRPLEGV